MTGPAAASAGVAPFAVMDCALITIATGFRAQTLREFRETLLKVPAGSIDHHFWGRLLRPQFDEPEFNNDFASWAQRGLHDKPLAEREGLRQELLEVVEQRLEESEMLPWAPAEHQFQFLRSQIVVFDTGLRYSNPADLIPYLSTLSTGSIYYHFIDARGRTVARCDDFSAWLEGFGERYAGLVLQLRSVDPYFSSLKELRHVVTEIFQGYFEEHP